MNIKFTIYLEHGFCRCFSDRDLKVNLEFAIKEGYRVLAVEAA
jgi:hypothetical protein